RASPISPPRLLKSALSCCTKWLPAVETIAMLVGPANSRSIPEIRRTQSAARTLGLRLLVFNVTTDAEIAAAFAMLVEHQAGAVLIGSFGIIITQQDQILSHAAHFALPTMFAFNQNARAGGLLSYGADLIENYRQVGVYTGRILK